MAKIISGRRKAPMRVLVYGPAGAGKSKLASAFKRPLFVSGQEGSSELDVQRYCFEDKTERTFALTWDEVLNSLTALKSMNGYDTLVVDELTAIEAKCAEHVCKANSWNNIGSVGFGRGEVALYAEMRILLKRVEEIHAQGKGVVFCAHVKQGKAARPETGEDYKRHEPALTSAANADIPGLFGGWCDAVLFLEQQVTTVNVGDAKQKRIIGQSNGTRVLYTAGSAGIVAKCRYKGVDPMLCIPLVGPLDEFFRQVEEGQSIEQMQSKIKAWATSLGLDVAAWLASSEAKDLDALHGRALYLKAKLAERGPEQVAA